MTTFPLLLMQRDRFVFSAWIVTYPKAVVLSKSLATEKRKVLVNVFFPVGSLVKRAIFFAPVKVKKIERKKKKESSLWETYLPVPWSYRVLSHDVTAAILVSQNNETAAMLVSQTNPVGVEFLSRLSLQQQQENNRSEPKQSTRYL